MNEKEAKTSSISMQKRIFQLSWGLRADGEEKKGAEGENQMPSGKQCSCLSISLSFSIEKFSSKVF